MAEVSIRKLKRKDRVFLTKLFTKWIEATGRKSISRLISSDRRADATEDESTEEFASIIIDLGIDITKDLLAFFDDEIGAWFADLLDVTPEELDEMDADIEIQVIKAIQEDRSANAFITQSLAAANMTKWFETPLKLAKERFGSIFAEEMEKAETSTTSDTTP